MLHGWSYLVDLLCGLNQPHIDGEMFLCCHICRAKVWERGCRQAAEDLILQGQQVENRSCEGLSWRLLQTPE